MLSKYILIIISFFFFFISSFFGSNLEMPPIVLTKQSSAINFKSNSLKLLSFGNQRLISALLWVTTVIESDIEHYKRKDNNSWIFLRFDTITDLYPRFYNAYKVGGLYLSVVKDDDVGAELIYKKGLKQFPNDMILNFQYGLHAYSETQKIDEAIYHFEKVVADPIGRERYKVFLPSLLAKLKVNETTLLDTFNFMLEMKSLYSNNKNLNERFENYLYAIKAEMDLSCLNLVKTNCNINDFEGAPYLRKNNGIYIAQKKWEKFRLKKE